MELRLKNVLNLAIYYKTHLSVIDWLLNNTVVNIDESEIVARISYFPLKLAISYYPDAIPLLIQHGARLDFNISIRNEGTFHGALQYAIRFGTQYSVDILLNAVEDVAIFGNNGTLQLAAKHIPDVIPTLLRAGFNPNYQDSHGNTVLHIIAMNRTYLLCELIPLDNFDWSIKNNDEKTVVDICNEILAKDIGNAETKMVLRKIIDQYSTPKSASDNFLDLYNKLVDKKNPFEITIKFNQ